MINLWDICSIYISFETNLLFFLLFETVLRFIGIFILLGNPLIR